MSKNQSQASGNENKANEDKANEDKAPNESKKSNEGPIPVTATQRGYMGVIRERGDKFEIQSMKQFSSKWMEKGHVDLPEEE